MSARPIPSALYVCDGAPVPARWHAVEWSRTHPIHLRGAGPSLTLRLENLSHQLRTVVDGRALDLLHIAAYLYAADQLVSRGGGADVFGERWQRRMALTIPVTEPDCWRQPAVYDRLTRLLTFLTDDLWEFEFSKGPGDPLQPSMLQGLAPWRGESDSVLLFSGGADSLCATVNAVLEDDRRPLLVSHRPSTPMSRRQKDLATMLRRELRGWEYPHVGLVVNRAGGEAADHNQRTRALLFASLGLVVAERLGLREVFFSDNGVVSINLPFTMGQYGAQASRSTHPRFIREVNALAALLFDDAPQIRNSLATFPAPMRYGSCAVRTRRRC